MSELPSIPNIPMSMYKSVYGHRKIGSWNVLDVGKTGSSLDVLYFADAKKIMRNSKLPADSMAVWELLHTHAAEILTDEASAKLFGPLGRLQVAPILDRKGKDRIYRYGSHATAYSELCGLDTTNLKSLLGVSGVIEPHLFTDNGSRQPRALESISYRLVHDVQQEDPEREDIGKLRNLMEDYWVSLPSLTKALFQQSVWSRGT